MRVGFNFVPYLSGTQGGAEVYFRNVLSAVACQESSPEVLCLGPRSYLASHNCQCVPLLSRQVSRPPNRLTRIIVEQLLLPLVCQKHRIDCLISNYVLPVGALCPQVVIVHDMLYRRYPELFERTKLFYWRTMIPLSVRRSASLVTVSDFSGREIKSFFPQVSSKLFTTVEGIRPSLQRTAVFSAANSPVVGKYLLCVATFGKHKNIHTLVDAFAGLPPKYSDLLLVLVGAARTPDALEYRAKVEEIAVRKKVNSRIRYLDHVSDQELALLYQGATALILPSLYEGFGLPIIEAQHFNCPVLCSDAASLPEVAGPGALLFDPFSVSNLRDTIITFLETPELSDKIREAGTQNVTKYTWNHAADELMLAVKHAIKNG